jgi:hypothetical protein
MSSEQMSPTFRVAVGTDPNSEVVGPNLTPRQPDVHFIKLHWGTSFDQVASDKAGKQVYDKTLLVRHIYPGTHDYLDVEIKRWPHGGGEPVIVDSIRLARYADLIEKFERKAKITDAGTPLAALNLDPATIANLQGSGVDTVEALAEVPDVALGALGMGARQLRERAKALFAIRDDNAPLEQLRAENNKLRDQLGVATEELAEANKEIVGLRSEVAEMSSNHDKPTVKTEPHRQQPPVPGDKGGGNVGGKPAERGVSKP